MKHQNKKRSLMLALPLLAVLGASAQAGVVNGKIISLYPDPDDYVIELNVPGPCGSKFFHLKRNALNFKEAVATAMVAFSLNKSVNVFQIRCEADRNVAATWVLLTKAPCFILATCTHRFDR